MSIAKRTTERTHLNGVDISGNPKKLKATITYQQELTVGQMIGIGVSTVAACGVGYYFGRLASKCKDSKVIKTLDRMFGVEDDLYEEENNDVDYVDVEVDEVKE